MAYQKTSSALKMEVNIYTLVSLVIIYIIVVFVGAYSSWKSHRRLTANGYDLILGNRSFGAFISIVAMTATWVSGSYITQTSQTVHDKGFVWSLPTFGYPISIALGGLLFAKTMRKDGYVTIMDPFQETLGDRFGGILSLLPIAGEILWSASTLASLGDISEALIGLDGTLAVVSCSCVTIAFTALGGIYSVTGTSAILLLLIICGLWFSLPFVLTNPEVRKLDLGGIAWIGGIPTFEISFYFDTLLMYMFGAVSWQSFYQRMLTIRNPERVRWVSFTAAVLCYIIVVPAIIIGVVARALDGNGRSREQSSSLDKSRIVFASILNYCTPLSISVIGYCVISSAVMSTASAALLSASSLISRNIYKKIIHKKATLLETSIIMRITIVAAGMGATAMAILLPSINNLWRISAIILYVTIMPQLLCIIYFKKYVNVCGSLLSCITGILMVVLSGDTNLGIPAFICYPFFDSDREIQLFPFKSIAMFTSLTTLLIFSSLSTCMLKRHIPLVCCISFCSNFRKSNQADSNEGHHTEELDLGLNAEQMNRQEPVETINPALITNGEMIELKDRKLAKLNLIKSEIFYNNNGESTDV